MAYEIIKRFSNHFGLDLKSTDLTRGPAFSSGMTNAQYDKEGSIEKRKGYQAVAENKGGHGLFVYNRINPSTNLEEPELLAVSNTVSKSVESTLNVSYSGAETNVILNIFYDTATSQYRCQIDEGTSQVLDYALGIGFDEASTVTIGTLSTAINALTDFTSSVTGSTSTPAAFIEIVRNHDLSATGSAYAGIARYWSDVNTPVSTPLAGSETNKNTAEFENVTAIQINNIMMFANGYDETLKYDGQNLYRAGLPDPTDDFTVTTPAGGGLGAGDYVWKIQYIQKDAVGNFVEGNQGTSLVATALASDKGTVPITNILASTGFNTNCAIVDGAQATVTTINVDDGAAGSHTLKVGDTAYFYDGVSAAYVEREITAVTGSTITISGAAVTVADNIPISNNLRIAIFRTKVGGTISSAFFLVDEIPNDSFNTVTSYDDTLTDVNLGAQFIEPITDRTAPPKGKYISSFRNQTIIMGNDDAPNTVFFADVDGPEYFPNDGTGEFDVNAVTGAKITGGAQNNEVFVVFQDPGVHVVSGDIAQKNIRVDQISSDVGCVAHATIKEVRGELYFLSDVGPRKMIGGQLPVPIGPTPSHPKSSRIDPTFTRTGLEPDEVYQVKRALAVQHRKDEKYILYIPTEETTGGDEHPNENSVIFVYDYSRDAWLQWDSMNLAGGSALMGDELFWSERRYSDYTTNVDHILYRQHNLDDAWDYQDNNAAINFEYKTQWEFMGEPSVFKKFLTLRVFFLGELPNNPIYINVKGEGNFAEGDTVFEFDYDLSEIGYGLSPYGIAPWGDNREPAKKHKLGMKKLRSLRFLFSNINEQENVLLTGWEILVAPVFARNFKS